MVCYNLPGCEGRIRTWAWQWQEEEAKFTTFLVYPNQRRKPAFAPACFGSGWVAPVNRICPLGRNSLARHSTSTSLREGVQKGSGGFGTLSKQHAALVKARLSSATTKILAAKVRTSDELCLNYGTTAVSTLSLRFPATWMRLEECCEEEDQLRTA